MNNEGCQVRFVPWEKVQNPIFPEITVLLVGTDVHMQTLWPDREARQHGIDKDKLLEMLEALPWATEVQWGCQRDASMRSWEFTGYAALLKFSETPILIAGLKHG